MPLFEEQEEFVPNPKGKYKSHFTSVRPAMIDFKDGNGPVRRLVWEAKGKLYDREKRKYLLNPETGHEYEIKFNSGLSYGNVEANLTQYVNSMFPDKTPKEKLNIEESDIIADNLYFIINLDVVTSKTGKVGNKVMFIEPYEPAAKIEDTPQRVEAKGSKSKTPAKPADVEDDEEQADVTGDPFAGED